MVTNIIIRFKNNLYIYIYYIYVCMYMYIYINIYDKWIYIYIHIWYICIVFIYKEYVTKNIYAYFLKLLQKVSLNGIWTHDHWIPFRRSNRMSYQAMSPTCTQSQFCTATPISSFAQCHISYRLFDFEVFCR